MSGHAVRMGPSGAPSAAALASWRVNCRIAVSTGGCINRPVAAVLDELHAARFPCLAKAFDLRLGIDERRQLADGAARVFDRHDASRGLQGSSCVVRFHSTG